MSKEIHSAELILKLYELRREDKMREARAWFIGFFPDSVEDVVKTMVDPATSAMYRMVTSYWDMAASFVNPFDVNYGNFTGASINAVTKSGTNTLKGDVYGFGGRDLGRFLQDPTVCRRTPRAVSEPEFVQAYGGSPYAATECT